jgi:hypothetical protein
MLFANAAVHGGIKLRPAMDYATAPGALLNQRQYLRGTGFAETAFYDVKGIQIYHRATRSSEI